MKLCVLGLGYVGAVSAGCLARQGHEVIGVGTPSLSNGDIDLKFVRRVCAQIGTALRRHHGAPVVAVRSTMLPGNAAPEFRDDPQRLTDRQTVIDFVRVSDSRSVAGVYEGICW